MPTDTAPDQPGNPAPGEPDDRPAPPAQSREDTDADWGEAAEPGDDDRLLRDRPPHWDDA